MINTSDNLYKTILLLLSSSLILTFLYLPTAFAKANDAQEKLIIKLNKQFKNCTPIISENDKNALQQTLGYIDDVKNDRKQKFSFEQGMLEATAAKHQSRVMCKGTLMGLVCEALQQLTKSAQTPAMKIYMIDRETCKKEKDVKSCRSKAGDYLAKNLVDIMNNGIKGNPLADRILALKASK